MVRKIAKIAKNKARKKRADKEAENKRTKQGGRKETQDKNVEDKLKQHEYAQPRVHTSPSGTDWWADVDVGQVCVI